MFNNRKILLLVFISLCSLFFIGCSPKGDPAETLTSYLQNIKDGNFPAAYDLISTSEKKECSLDDFVLKCQLDNELTGFKEFKITPKIEKTNIVIDSVTYQNVAYFSVTATDILYYEDKKEVPYTYERCVVNDSGQWKVLRSFNNDEAISANYQTLGWMYQEGKGKDKDLNQAAMFFNKSIEYDKNNSAAYFGLAYVYKNLGRYDEAIDSCNKLINIKQPNEEMSDNYNLLGTIYQNKGNFPKAIDCYQKALELNSQNEYAKGNLKNLL